jgi:two-component system, NarL family, nitrate/nitrite response regulator NarL
MSDSSMSVASVEPLDAFIRILLVDHHPLYREGVASAIRGAPDLELIGEAGRGDEALSQVRGLAPSVAVVDLDLPDVRGTALLEALAREAPSTRVLVVSSSTRGSAVYSALEAGAAGYVSKDVGRARICEAIRAVARGETVIDSSLEGALAEQVRLRHSIVGPRLTAREREILSRVASGASAAAIARELFISAPTVKTHLRRIYEKLGVTDRAAAVAVALRQGLID